jgi:hypothetical protein
MAKASKPTPVPAKQPTPAKQPSKPVARTEVRNSPIPQVAAAAPAATAARPAPKAVSQELIARRAYEIWASGQGGSELENWIRAERELRGM